MKTEEQIEKEFTAKLKLLISEYGESAELECKDYYVGYAECGEDVHMKLIVPSQWDDSGEQTQAYCEISLGPWIRP